MIIKKMVTECDLTNKHYENEVQGGAVIAEGADGKWAEVLHVGPEEIEKRGESPVSLEEALVKIEESGGWFQT